MTKEEIELEGWKYTGKSIDIWFEKAGQFERSSWTSYRAEMHYGLHDNWLYISLDDIGDTTYIFQGIIKTIDEFKILMKQLNIN